MDKTPMCGLLQEIIDNTFSETDTINLTDLQLLISRYIPTERQFAETCFDAGVNYEYYAKCADDKMSAFDNFYKQYTHD